MVKKYSGKHDKYTYDEWSMTDCPFSGRELNILDVDRAMSSERIALCPKCSFQFVLPLESETFRVPLHTPARGLPRAQA